MVYKVVFSDRANSDLQAILDDATERYTPREQLSYIVGLQARAERLDMFPKRGNAVVLQGMEYWRMNYKAHTAFYRVLEDENLVVVVAVLHSRMTWQDKL